MATLKNKTAATKTEGAVNLRERVEVKGIKHADPKKQKMKVGKVYKVHPLTAENLIATGHAEKV